MSRKNTPQNGSREDITELIREKVDYLVIVPADLDALVPALQSAKEAGIPVILIEQIRRYH